MHPSPDRTALLCKKLPNMMELALTKRCDVRKEEREREKGKFNVSQDVANICHRPGNVFGILRIHELCAALLF